MKRKPEETSGGASSSACGASAREAEVRGCENQRRRGAPGVRTWRGRRGALSFFTIREGRLLRVPESPPAAADTAAASKAALLGCAAAPTSSHPHTERDNKQSLRYRGRLPLVRHNTAHTHSRTKEGRRGGRPHCQSVPRRPIGALSPQPLSQS